MIIKTFFCSQSIAILSLLVCSFICSCDGGSSKNIEDSYPTNSSVNDIASNIDDYRKVADTDGNYILVPKKIDGIASLSPAVTDIILALGFYEQLILVDYYSYQVGRAIATNDKIIKTDMLSPSIEAIVESGCNVVFISDINYMKDRLAVLEALGITVINIPTNNRLYEIDKSIMFLGRILEAEAIAKDLSIQLNRNLRYIQDLSKNVTRRQRVYFEMEPPPNIYTFGNGVFLNDIIDLIGAINVFEDEKGWIKVSEESVIESNPQVIIAFERHGISKRDDMSKRAGWQHIEAIQNERVHFMNNDGILSRPTHNIIKPIVEIAKYVYPDVYANLE